MFWISGIRNVSLSFSFLPSPNGIASKSDENGGGYASEHNDCDGYAKYDRRRLHRLGFFCETRCFDRKSAFTFAFGFENDQSAFDHDDSVRFEFHR